MLAMLNKLDRLAVGTVQFGIDYGISNKSGMTHELEVAQILDYAFQQGIRMLDTAPSYGKGEDVIGLTTKDYSFKIVTKTPVFKKSIIEKTDAECLISTFHNSLKKMSQLKLYGLLIHHAGDLSAVNGDLLWHAMTTLKESGFVEKIGVSIYSPKDIDLILDKYTPDIVQLPTNVLDQRFLINGYLKLLKKRDIEIHCRSVFLQGLLLMPLSEIPNYFDPIKPILKMYHEDVKTFGMTPVMAALGFVYNQPEIDCIIVGVNNKCHMEEIIEAVNALEDKSALNYSKYAVNDENIVNPSLWRL